MEKIVLIGAGGYFSGVADSIITSSGYDIVGVTDPVRTENMCGIPVLGDDSILEDIYSSGVKGAHITVGCIGNYDVRRRLVEQAKKIGFELVSIVDRSASVSTFVQMGEMTYVAKNAIINSNVTIGNYCIINSGSIVEHGCRLGNYVHIAPGAVLAADVTVGNGTHIGINSSIRQGISIGENVMVGAGSVVLGDVASNRTVYGIIN